jgi:hypothetical protein
MISLKNILIVRRYESACSYSCIAELGFYRRRPPSIGPAAAAWYAEAAAVDLAAKQAR